MSLSDVHYQPRAARLLQRALASERVPHAYLFAGPDGVGKETMAGGLAQLLLCTSPVRRAMPAEPEAGEEVVEGVDACGVCQDCRLVLAGTHPDLAIVYRQLARQHPESDVRRRKAAAISVDVIRYFLIEHAGTYPSRGRARVFIVREAERMTDQAQNSLLKTLEEPPPRTFIILLTSALDRMLPTTRSRCQAVTFQSLPVEYVRRRVPELRPDTPAAEVAYAAAHSAGSLGAALRCIGDGLFALKRTWGERLVELAYPRQGFAPHALARPFQADAKTLGKAAADLDPDMTDTDAARAGVQSLLSVLSDFYMDALRKASGAQLPAINADQPEIIERLAGLGPPALTVLLAQLSEAEANIQQNANIELALEALFIRLAREAGLACATVA